MTTPSPLTTLLANIDQMSPNQKVKGDYFELLAQWWLENEPYYKAK